MLIENALSFIQQDNKIQVNVLAMVDGQSVPPIPNSNQGSETYIAALNPRIDNVFVAQIPESTIFKVFTVTDQLGGVEADEYLRYEGDHLVINHTWAKNTSGTVVRRYCGAIIRPTGGGKFELVSNLNHEECTKIRSVKRGVTVANIRYSDYANVQKAEEVRYAEQVWIQENQITRN